MRKAYLTAAAISMAALLLAGCDQIPIPGTAPAGTEAPAEESTAVTETEEASAAESESPAETDESGDTAAAAGAETQKTAGETDGKGEDISGTVSEQEAQILNNGGYFVQRGTKVYYRVPEFEALRTPQLWGEYANTYSGGSVITVYDTETRETQELFSDNGYGPVYFSGEYLYLQEQDENGNACVERVDPESGSRERLDDSMSLCGVEGETIAVSGFDRKNQCLSIDLYKGTEKIGSVAPESQIYDFSGIGGGYVIYKTITENEGESDSLDLWSHNIQTNEEAKLGTLPKASAYDAEWLVQDQFLASDGKIYIGMGGYSGTAHVYSGGCYLAADPAAAGSLEIINIDDVPAAPVKEVSAAVPEETETEAETETAEGTAEENAEDTASEAETAAETAAAADAETESEAEGESAEDEELWRTPAFAVIDGTLVRTEGIPGTAAVDSNGNLGFYDENGAFAAAASGWEEVLSEEEDTVARLEKAEYLDGRIFSYWNEEWRAEEADVGWREAYERKFAYVYCTNCEDGKTRQIGFAQNPKLVEGDVDQSEEEA